MRRELQQLIRKHADGSIHQYALRFEFNAAQKKAVLAGATVKLGCDHTHYPAHVAIEPETLASLAGDLR